MEISKKLIYTIVAGIAYCLIIRFTEFSLPCPIKYLTGYKCPGCGITTMMLALLEGDWQGAKGANIFLFYMLPTLALAIIIFQNKSNDGVRYRKLYNDFLGFYLFALISFGIYRNIVDI